VPTAAPTITGTAQVGQTLTTSLGAWTADSNIKAYAYAWGRCDANGNACVMIAGANASTYKLVADDQNHTMRSYITATNANGTTTENSPQTAAVKAGTTTPTNGALNAADVTLPNRLIIDQVKYSANPIHARKSPTSMQIHVSDSHNNSVSGALVFVQGLPYSRVNNMPEVSTNSTGWATVNLQPGKFFPRTGYVVMFVRARVSGQDALAGSSTRRLVQVTVGAPNGS
jgi:hypothetical protein